jgi:5-dehydro-4-deoxyglucarate dehydratase
VYRNILALSAWKGSQVPATSPETLKRQLASGLLAFPVTPFNAALAFDEVPFRAHIDHLLDFNPAALFVAGGAGEFFSLTLEEFSSVVTAAVQQTNGRVPVVAGCGYGTAMATQFARTAEDAGADGLLLLPPYLVKTEPAGLAAHVQQVSASTKLGVVFYNRDNAILDDQALAELCDAAPNLIGFKDGVGDIESVSRICTRFRGRLTTICGMPTAESFALQYFDLGASTYSSAIFSFLPRFAQQFYAAAKRADRETVDRLTREFLAPYVELRRRRPGYAVSIVKAGLRATGQPAGPVRPPLTDLDRKEMQMLANLVAPYI